MCLDNVALQKPKAKGIGYVAMRLNFNEYYAEYKGSGPYKLHKWYKAEEQPHYWYRLGFHILTTLEDAVRWGITGSRIVKVKYKEAHTQGDQQNMLVIVAAKRKIIKYMGIVSTNNILIDRKEDIWVVRMMKKAKLLH